MVKLNTGPKLAARFQFAETDMMEWRNTRLHKGFGAASESGRGQQIPRKHLTGDTFEPAVTISVGLAREPPWQRVLPHVQGRACRLRVVAVRA